MERQQLLVVRLGTAAGVLASSTALVLGGCAHDGESAAPSPAAVAALADVERRKDVVSDLEYRLVQKCMGDQGYDVLPPRPVVIPDQSPDGSLSLDQARDVGYGIGTLLRAPPDGGDVAAGAGSWDASSDDYRRRVTVAMFGQDDDGATYDFGGGSVSMSTTGCYADVRKQLFGDLQSYLKYTWIASNGLQGARGDVVGDEVEKLDAAWSSCMSDHGLDVATPDSARERAASAYAGKGADVGLAAERKIAIQDSECRVEVHYDETLADLRDRGAATYLASHESEVIAYSALLDDAERKGQELLQGGS